MRRPRDRSESDARNILGSLTFRFETSSRNSLGAQRVKIPFAQALSERTIEENRISHKWDAIPESERKEEHSKDI